MSHQPEKTFIVFPRIAGRDGFAKTLNKKDFFDYQSDDDNPMYNPARYGVSEEEAYMKADKKLLTTQLPPNVNAQEARTSQVFRSNYKKPDEATRKLINSRRCI